MQNGSSGYCVRKISQTYAGTILLNHRTVRNQNHREQNHNHKKFVLPVGDAIANSCSMGKATTGEHYVNINVLDV